MGWVGCLCPGGGLFGGDEVTTKPVLTDLSTIEHLEAAIHAASAEFHRLRTINREMLEALELGHRYLVQRMVCPNVELADTREVLDQMWATIKKARGGQ